MPDILHEFPIAAPIARVYEAVSTPRGLDAWWTLTSAGSATVGTPFALGFGPEYQWQAVVREATAPTHLAFQFVSAMDDWTGTTVRIELAATAPDSTLVRFAHTGWATASEHFRVSSFCWAMYLRLLRRYVEHGEIVPYASRLDV